MLRLSQSITLDEPVTVRFDADEIDRLCGQSCPSAVILRGEKYKGHMSIPLRLRKVSIWQAFTLIK